MDFLSRYSAKPRTFGADACRVSAVLYAVNPLSIIVTNVVPATIENEIQLAQPISIVNHLGNPLKVDVTSALPIELTSVDLLPPIPQAN